MAQPLTRKLLIPVGMLVLGLLLGGLIFAWVVESRLQRLETLEKSHSIAQVNTASDELPRRSFEPTTDFDKAAYRTLDAVVYISSRIKGHSGVAADFFHVPQRSSGSGVMITEDGYIVTNHHVILGADEVVVTLNNKEEFVAEIIASDPTTDLAVVKIDAQGLPKLDFADSDNVRIGNWVLAVGNPFNLTSTVTAGIVSAKARSIGILRNSQTVKDNGDYSIESFIQTDAVVNPGNSGGALVDLDGNLIGINTAIASETGVYQGYSFAIPSNLVRKVVTDLIEYGVVQRGFLGVSIQDIDQEVYENEDLAVREGAYVTDLTPGGAAISAGIQSGDVIIGLNDKRVTSASELQEQTANYRPGETVTVHVRRGERTFKQRVTLRNLQGKTQLTQPRKKRPSLSDRFGGQFEELPETKMQELDIKGGAMITTVAPDGPLDRAGVKVGFVITHVDKNAVRNKTELFRYLRQARKMAYLEGLKPNGQKAYYIIELVE